MAGQNYSDKYIEQVFYLWYEDSRKGGKSFVNTLPPENGIKPSVITLNKWIAEKGWIERADALDAEVSIVLDEKVIKRRSDMFEQHAEIGKEMREKGIKFLQDNPLQDSQAAIRAVVSGIEIERISVGQAEAYAKISKMTDAQITKELERLSGKVKEDEFIDAEIDETDTESNS